MDSETSLATKQQGDTTAADARADGMVRVYQALAAAFAREGVRTAFTLMGDGNMHWVVALEQNGVEVIHVRHEHCACTAAMGHAMATGDVGVASVTCGPGFTQIMTALVTAARGQVPLVVLAGEAPINLRWHNQNIAQAPFATASGAHYIACHSIARMLDNVRDAFFIARSEQKPVVLGIPYDLQQEFVASAADYRASTLRLVPAADTRPDPQLVGEVARRLALAKRPVVIAGRGVVKSGAASEVAELARRCGALLGTTLMSRGLFDDEPFSLGIIGGYGSELSHELVGEADVVVAIGASLATHTSDGGKLFRDSFVVQIDPDPRGLNHGLYAADCYLRSDARETVKALLAALPASRSDNAFRTEALARRIATESADPHDYPVAAGTFHPRAAIEMLDHAIPKDWDIVAGTGHSAYFVSQLRNRSPERFHTVREFGAIGNSLGLAIGVAAARRDGAVVLMEGDGSMLMHIQEFETIRRHGLRLLICVLNDGAYGSEIHKLRHDGLDVSGSSYGIEDFAAVAQGFRLRGTNISRLEVLPSLLEAYRTSDRAEIWNVPISDLVMSPTMRRSHRKK